MNKMNNKLYDEFLTPNTIVTENFAMT